jgi:lambda repressor-like predicted transcriptional regulator
MNNLVTAKYLSLTHLSQHSSLSVKTLRYFLNLPHNPLPHYRMARKILVDVDEFDAWLRRFRVIKPGLDLDKIFNEIMADLL